MRNPSMHSKLSKLKPNTLFSVHPFFPDVMTYKIMLHQRTYLQIPAPKLRQKQIMLLSPPHLRPSSIFFRAFRKSFTTFKSPEVIMALLGSRRGLKSGMGKNTWLSLLWSGSSSRNDAWFFCVSGWTFWWISSLRWTNFGQWKLLEEHSCTNLSHVRMNLGWAVIFT